MSDTISLNYLGPSVYPRPGGDLTLHRFLFAKAGKTPGRCPYGYDSESGNFTEEERSIRVLDDHTTGVIVTRLLNSYGKLGKFYVSIDVSAFPSVVVAVDELHPGAAGPADDVLIAGYESSTKTKFPVVYTNMHQGTTIAKILTL